MDAWLKRSAKEWGIALVLFLSALGAAFAAPQEQRELFRPNTFFSMDFPEGIVVKNSGTKGYGGKEYGYGDKCVATSRGEFWVVENASGYIAARYRAPEGELEPDQCPTGVQTSFAVKFLEDRRLRAEAKREEQKFLMENFPQRPEQ